jgi:hypothetical protein
MIGEDKRPRQCDRWTPGQDQSPATINLSEDKTFLLSPRAKNLDPSVSWGTSAATRKLYGAETEFKFSHTQNGGKKQCEGYPPSPERLDLF